MTLDGLHSVDPVDASIAGPQELHLVREDQRRLADGAIRSYSHNATSQHVQAWRGRLPYCGGPKMARQLEPKQQPYAGNLRPQRPQTRQARLLLSPLRLETVWARIRRQLARTAAERIRMIRM